MKVTDKVAIITGAAGGIGAAVGRRLLADGAKVVFADLDGDGVRRTAEAAAASAQGRADFFVGDVSSEAALRDLIARANAAFGPVDIFHANAAVGGLGGLDADDRQWEQAWQINTMAHVRAARLLVDDWLTRGEGYFISTASAAGLLTQLGAAPYTLSKHAAVAFAEWLSITYGGRGLRVSCLCPQAVDTQMLAAAHRSSTHSAEGARAIEASGAVLTPEQVASAVAEAIAAERFLILPHPEVGEYVRRKASDHERWLTGMRRLQARVNA
jgi:NAD(P)-dependent dehydrogenase (short-subunit alcohol dehydrogenase family)